MLIESKSSKHLKTQQKSRVLNVTYYFCLCLSHMAVHTPTSIIIYGIKTTFPLNGHHHHMALSTISSGYSPADSTAGGGGENSSIYQLLLNRCRSLEASYASLQEQFHMLEQVQTSSSSSTCNHHGKLIQDEMVTSRSSFNGWIGAPDILPVGFSYKRALDQVGHAVYVSKAVTREIIYWYEKCSILVIIIFFLLQSNINICC